jgi:hypothetical protein
MFSGRWERGLKRDKDGAVFFDCNPRYFGCVLEYLRTKRMATPENPAKLSNVQPDDLQHIATLVEYLGLGDEIAVSASETNEVAPAHIVPTEERFNLHGPNVTLEEEGKMAVHSSNWGHDYALEENRYQRGIAHVKLKLEAFKNNHWIFVGIVEADAIGEENSRFSYKWPGSYGWALGWTGQVWQDGLDTHDNSLANLAREGETVELVLDCDAAKLSLHFPTDKQFHIDLPKSKTWRLNVNMCNSNDKIRIINQ